MKKGVIGIYVCFNDINAGNVVNCNVSDTSKRIATVDVTKLGK